MKDIAVATDNTHPNQFRRPVSKTRPAIMNDDLQVVGIFRMEPISEYFVIAPPTPQGTRFWLRPVKLIDPCWTCWQRILTDFVIGKDGPLPMTQLKANDNKVRGFIKRSVDQIATTLRGKPSPSFMVNVGEPDEVWMFGDVYANPCTNRHVSVCVGWFSRQRVRICHIGVYL